MGLLDRAIREQQAAELRALLHQHEGLAHLRVECRGTDLVIFSEEDGEKIRRARLTAVGAGRYGLSLMRHTGRWERTPLAGPLPEMVEMLVSALGFHLARWP